MPTERFSYVPYLFYQSMDEKIKTWSLRFPAKENPNMEKAFFDWLIVLQYDVKAKYRLISRKSFGHDVFSPECSLNQLKASAFVSVRQTNHSRPQCLRVWECALDLSPVHAQKSSGSRLQTNQIALFPFVFCFCFVRALSFQCHTKIAQTRLHSRFSEEFTCNCKITASF